MIICLRKIRVVNLYMQVIDNKKKSIIVIGDVMLDEYVFGTVNRVSPESCCPILLTQNITYQLGGAANVAFQITKQERNVILAGIIGKDTTADILINQISNASIDSRLIFKHNVVTTKKTRYVNNVNQQMFRVDNEEHSILNLNELSIIQSFLKNHAEEIDCVILSDYNKGVLTNESCQYLIETANQMGIPIVVDIKIPNIKKYQNATVIKGNMKEFSAFFPPAEIKTETLEANMRILRRKLKAKNIVVTLGRDGIAGMDNHNNFVHHKSNQVLVYDVTGAGDVVTAYIGAYIRNYPFNDILYYANIAAGIKVTRFGNSFIPFNEVFPFKCKIKKASEIATLKKDKTIVFTNGCFDVFHAGHTDLLQYAKTKGDILVVGINTDESVKRLKGEKRPINNLEMRMKVLCAMSVVDYIIPFEEDTPEKIIREVHPDVLIKGGDYTLDEIVGSDFVKSYGGLVIAMPHHYNTSTTQILSTL